MATTISENIEIESTVIERAKRDSQAFRPLYDSYYKDIFLFIFRRVKDKQQAADITSQVFLNAMLNLKKYENRGLPFSSWLYRIAVNQVSLFFRKQKRVRFVTLEETTLTNLHEELTADLSLEHLQDILPKMLQKLTERELQLIELRFFERLSFQEIARILDVTEVNAKVKLYRILNKLKRYFKDEKQN